MTIAAATHELLAINGFFNECGWNVRQWRASESTHSPVEVSNEIWKPFSQTAPARSLASTTYYVYILNDGEMIIERNASSSSEVFAGRLADPEMFNNLKEVLDSL